jgi:cell division protein FtsB
VGRRIRIRIRKRVTVVLPRAAEEVWDARPADAPPRGGKPDPDLERRGRFRRGVVVFVLSVVFVVGTVALFFGERGFLDARRQRAELRELQTEVNDELAHVQALKAEVKRLQNDPTAIERVAREELGFAKPGEIQFLLPDNQPPDLGAGARAAKPQAPSAEGDEGGTPGG